MPMYEYRCKKCQDEFEELVFGDAAVMCPSCGCGDTEKLMSCCRHKHGGASAGVGAASAPAAPSGGGCGGCPGGSCSTCK